MKLLRIIISVISISLLTMTDLYGQSFMRYKMKDGSYNGFYTNAVDSIAHVTENGAIVQKVYSCESVRTIPVDDIVEISFEGASLNSEQDAGEYKIVEFEGKEGFKKAYVDNRATLIASKTGDFVNDTILVASAYNNLKILFFTDNEGRVTRYFDGVNQIIFDVDDEAYVLTDFSDPSTRSTKGVGKVIWKSLYKALENKSIQAFLKLNEISASYLIENLDAVANDPELHSQRCIVASLSLAGALIDPVACVSSILALLNYNDDNPAKLFDDFYGGIVGSISDLLNEMHPDYETREKYAKFYANKYNILLSPEDPTDITATSATLHSTIYTEDGLRGNLYFHLWNMSEDDNDIHVPATDEYSRVNEFKVNATISNLKPDSWYLGYLVYEVIVDRLKLELRSESFDFCTLTPLASTGDVIEVTDNSATVKCSFSNVPLGATCGVEIDENRRVSASKDAEQVTLSGLSPNTDYSYRAYITYQGETYYGFSMSFTTKLPDVAGRWYCKETHTSSTGKVSYSNYYVILHKDGTAEYSEQEDIVKGSWKQTETKLRVDFTLLNTGNYGTTSGLDLEITFKDSANPTSGTGWASYWALSNANWTGDTHGYELEMYR